MAPYLSGPSSSPKRSAADDDLEPRPAKRPYKHHHQPRWRQASAATDGICDDAETVDTQLRRGLGLVLEAVGFEQAGAAALEGFEMLVLEYMAHFLSHVRHSMLAARRIQPIAPDFLAAIQAYQLSLRALLPHLKPPVTPTATQPPLDQVPASDDVNHVNEVQRISLMLHDANLDSTKRHVPSYLPPFPSQHTYRAEAVYRTHQLDARQVRELATEEGRLGEQALRRLVSQQAAVQPAQTPHVNQQLDARQRRRLRTQEIWRETMAAVAAAYPAIPPSRPGIAVPGETDQPTMQPPLWERHRPPVNADRVYWRQPAKPPAD